jgi:uncharacterized damage-inducible protein DinB
MNIIPFLLKELDQESKTTEKFLKLIPVEKFDWKPHTKSMSLKQLSTHIAEIPGWIDISINTDGIDFADGSYKPVTVNTSDELIALLKTSVAKAFDALSTTSEEELLKTWTMKNGDQLLGAMTKYEAVRHSFSQTTHHRAQLGVFLRLLDIPIPGSYGPSADDQAF